MAIVVVPARASLLRRFPLVSTYVSVAATLPAASCAGVVTVTAPGTVAFTDGTMVRSLRNVQRGTTLLWLSRGVRVTVMVSLLSAFAADLSVLTVVFVASGGPARNTSAVFTGDTGWAAPAGTSATHTLYVPAFVVFTVDEHSPDPFV
ncbi:hypothetical protein EKO40_24855, partial [Salmonella enterica]|nr:hypothetical protein [Salmonella enterica]